MQNECASSKLVGGDDLAVEYNLVPICQIDAMPAADCAGPSRRPVAVRNEKRGHQADLSQPCDKLSANTGAVGSEAEVWG
jgi:hypothetical protein